MSGPTNPTSNNTSTRTSKGNINMNLRDPGAYQKFLEAIQLVSVFGGSITFTLIVGSNAPPTKRFTDQIVRDLLSAARLCFFLVLGGATAIRLGFTDKSRAMQRPVLRLLQAHRSWILCGFLYMAIILLSVTVLAYSDVGWAALALISLGCVLSMVVGHEKGLSEQHP